MLKIVNEKYEKLMKNLNKRINFGKIKFNINFNIFEIYNYIFKRKIFYIIYYFSFDNKSNINK